MKLRNLVAIASLAGVLFIFSSCQKDIDTVQPEDEVMGTPLPGQPTYCRIESFWERPFASDQVFRIVGYDQYENPTFISTPFVNTGNPFHTFKYDVWHRLIEYAQVFGNGNYLTLHHYGFDNNGRIGVDTAWNLGGFNSMGGPADNYNNRVISILTYDAQGRIIHSSNTLTVGPTFPPIPPIASANAYSYDAAGNLEILGATYDNKMNINRTNDIWQFLARDYSMNNRLTATSYNTVGFPTTINQLEEYRFINSNEIRLNHSQISYMCRPANF